MRRALALAILLMSCDKPPAPPPGPPPPAPPTPPAPAVGEPSYTAAIAGRVRFEGARPRPRFHSIKHEECERYGRIPDEGLLVNDDGTLRNAFVYVKRGLERARYAAATQPVTLDQASCRFVPHVLGLRTGQPLVVRNSDDTLHNFHLRAIANREVNEGFPCAGFQTTIRLDNPEVMAHATCDLHPWMSAYIGVLAHPCFAVTGTDGAYELRPLPPGHYTVEAWHESLGVQKREIEVAAGAVGQADFTFRAK